MGATKIAKTISRADGCGHVKSPNSRTEWHIRKRSASETHRKEQRLQQPNWTGCQTLGFVHDVPASGVVMIPNGNYREAGERHLRRAKGEETVTVR